MTAADLGAVARQVIDGNVYMALGTADEGGRPWVSPVYFAADAYRDFYWISSPEVAHSRNLARRPDVSIVVFDSRAPIGAGDATAVYMTATAAEVQPGELERGLAVYPGPAERGGGELTPADVSPPAPYRLYRATVTGYSVLCRRDAGDPCADHGLAFDHRTDVRVA